MIIGLLQHQFVDLFLSGILVIAIALLTISFQAVKAVLANPVKGLKAG